MPRATKNSDTVKATYSQSNVYMATGMLLSLVKVTGKSYNDAILIVQDFLNLTTIERALVADLYQSSPLAFKEIINSEDIV
jgi:hypothetical protein